MCCSHLTDSLEPVQCARCIIQDSEQDRQLFPPPPLPLRALPPASPPPYSFLPSDSKVNKGNTLKDGKCCGGKKKSQRQSLGECARAVVINRIKGCVRESCVCLRVGKAPVILQEACLFLECSRHGRMITEAREEWGRERNVLWHDFERCRTHTSLWRLSDWREAEVGEENDFSRITTD